MSNKKPSTLEKKQLRAVHANTLILSIASYGRKFFRHEDTVAKLFVQPSGRVFILDEYTRKLIYTHYKGHWDGFNNGGTLRNLVCMLRDYIMTGERIHIGHICTQRRYDESNIWGYSEEEAAALRKEVESNPCIFTPNISETSEAAAQ